ncbi:DUF1570 domain-containing protein [Aporhodopirellula aestuarii]|uniref:DUF1570 domain-containing protein n=1 Tax=Aporhodopirellula aestuarii TaxID=2950107 RepID=A0ABT0U8G1_9BACT|nr:DUF1570 domain-containing protein [Aporhodopirellula aestuarii]MCM2373264.1 DUF1570 domain-containing protein [Aporhodopirellula aestuarii]
MRSITLAMSVTCAVTLGSGIVAAEPGGGSRPSSSTPVANRVSARGVVNRTAARQGPHPVQFLVDSRWQTGLHLIDSATESLVIAEDGWLHTVAANQREQLIRITDERFEPASATRMRNHLQAEFGPKFEVVATNNFLVVQPRGRGDRWPKMFEDSHRSFVDYMSKRGVKVRTGRFPMVAVVLPDARAMYDELDRLGIDVSRVAGIYANRCNRVMTHDGGRLSDIAATVRHEAAHQSAFNSGVHSRVNDTPSWITEGIGQMFEPEALASGRAGAGLSDRLNRESLNHLRKHLSFRDSDEITAWVEQLVDGDEAFRDAGNVHTAYAVAWAMMFYLSERDSESFADILNFTATRPPFEAYRRGQRRIDFERIVDTDTATFSKRLMRFLISLP